MAASNKRAILLVFLLALWPAAPAWTAPSERAAPPQPHHERVVLQLKWYHGFQFAGYYAALHKGFYEEEGLSVTLREGGASYYSVEEVMAGRATFGVSSPNVLLDRLAGKKVVALASVFQHSPTIALARKDSGIATPSDLAGRKVMIARDSSPEILAMLRNEGLSMASFQSVPISAALDELIDGKVDARTAYLTNEPYLMERLGVAPAIIRPSTYGIDFYGDILVTSEAEVKGDLDRVRAFLRASLRGWHYTLQNPQEIVDLVLAHYSQVRTRDHLLYEAKAMAGLINADLVEIGHMNPYRWRHIAETFVGLGMTAPDFSLEGFLFKDWLENDWAARQNVRIIRALLLALALVIVFGLAIHVRSRIREQRAIRQSAELYRAVIETSADGFWMLDLDGRIVGVNDAYVRRSGYSRQELLGKPVYELNTIESPADTAAHIQAIRAKGSEHFETQHRTKSGALWDVESRVSYADVMGGRIFCFLRDITDRKAVEKQLHASLERLATSNTELERFAYVASHDLREPVRTLVSYSQLLGRRLGAEVQGEVREFLDFIVAAAKRMDSLVSDLLTYARVSNDDQPFEPIDLNEVLDEVRQDLGPAIEQAYAAIAAQPLPRVMGVKIQLYQLFQNLVGNALKFRRKDQFPRLEIAAFHEADRWHLTFRDNGIGIDPQYAEQIFVIFKRLHASQAYPGTGVGLAICRRIMERHHGRIWATPAPDGAGAVFHLDFPDRVEIESRPVSAESAAG
ncbi:MAG: ABC transporter substrate-binding protein [Rhodospirillales bacterium]|nr:ABC transporter substrate-binding protein [Rhodospirillales bacterium]